MKLVTQKRILNALENLYRLMHKSTVMQQTSVFAEDGLKSRFGMLQDVDDDKLNLELQLIEGEVPKSVEDFSAKFDRLMKIVNKRRSKIHEIQIKHGVSGLEWQVVNNIEFPFFNDMLRPLVIDMSKLSEFKESIVRHWIDYSVGCGLKSHQEMGCGWEPIHFNEIWRKSDDFDWANIWINEHYLSPYLLATKGDSPRDEPKCSDDRLYVEFHLSLGRGEAHNSTASDVLWCCATTEETL